MLRCANDINGESKAAFSPLSELRFEKKMAIWLLEVLSLMLEYIYPFMANALLRMNGQSPIGL